MAPDLIACFATLAGPIDVDGPMISSRDFRLRAEAASTAGYTGIGLIHGDLMNVVSVHGYGGIASILSDTGLQYLELEAMLDWFTDGDRRRQSDAARRDLLIAAEKLGARHVKVAGDIFGAAVDQDVMRCEFEEIARQAKDAGTQAVIEPIAFSSIPDLATALYVLGDTAGKGGGLLIDAWHAARGGYSVRDIAALPEGALFACELDDGPAREDGDPLSETMNARRLCGEGEFDLAGLIAAVRHTGFDGPWGVEIFSTEQRSLSLPDAARRSFETTSQQFDFIGVD